MGLRMTNVSYFGVPTAQTSKNLHFLRFSGGEPELREPAQGRVIGTVPGGRTNIKQPDCRISRYMRGTYKIHDRRVNLL